MCLPQGKSIHLVLSAMRVKMVDCFKKVEVSQTRTSVAKTQRDCAHVYWFRSILIVKLSLAYKSNNKITTHNSELFTQGVGEKNIIVFIPCLIQIFYAIS